MKEAEKSHGPKSAFRSKRWLIWTSIRLLRNILAQAVPASEHSTQHKYAIQSEWDRYLSACQNLFSNWTEIYRYHGAPFINLTEPLSEHMKMFDGSQVLPFSPHEVLPPYFPSRKHWISSLFWFPGVQPPCHPNLFSAYHFCDLHTKQATAATYNKKSTKSPELLKSMYYTHSS